MTIQKESPNGTAGNRPRNPAEGKVKPSGEEGPGEIPAKGPGVIEGYLKTLPGRPGVYRMINSKGDGRGEITELMITSYDPACVQARRGPVAVVSATS